MPKVTEKLKANEFKDMSLTLLADLKAIYGLFHISINETLNIALLENWTMDRLITTFTSMQVPGIEQSTSDGVIKQIDFSKIIGPGKKKLYLSRMADKYNWTGGDYQALMGNIIEFNSEKIGNKVARTQIGKMRKKIERLGTKAEKMTFPDLNEVFPGRSLFVRKGAEQGLLLSDELRDQLTGNLRKAVIESGFTYERGNIAGKVNQKTINNFRKQIETTFKNYTGVDPKIGVPTNLNTIAVTEVRSSVNDAKFKFSESVASKNDLIAVKFWEHNPSLSKEPRPVHAEIEVRSKQNPIPLDEVFVLSNGTEMQDLSSYLLFFLYPVY